MQVSRKHIVFDESALWYSLPSLTPKDFELIAREDTNEVDSFNEEDIGTLIESLI